MRWTKKTIKGRGMLLKGILGVGLKRRSRSSRINSCSIWERLSTIKHRFRGLMLSIRRRSKKRMWIQLSSLNHHSSSQIYRYSSIFIFKDHKR